MLKNIKGNGPIFVSLAALLWSLDGLLRITLYSLPSSAVVFLEHFLGALVLLILVKKWGKEIFLLSQKEWLAISLVSLFSGALGTIFYTKALAFVNYSQFSVVVLLQQLQPVWAIAASAIFLKEKITIKFIFWAVLALSSAYLIAFKDLSVNLLTGDKTAMAGILALSAGLMWGTSTAISKYVLKNISFLTATALRFYLAAVFAFLILFFEGQSAVLKEINPSQWLTLIAITFSTGLIALVIYYYGLKKTPAHIATICELVWPASAVLIDYFYFHKSLSPSQIIGICFLLIAIRKISYEKEKK